jgi:hypothetical protein
LKLGTYGKVPRQGKSSVFSQNLGNFYTTTKPRKNVYCANWRFLWEIFEPRRRNVA